MTSGGVFIPVITSKSDKVESLTVLRGLETQGDFTNNARDSNIFASFRARKDNSQTIPTGSNTTITGYTTEVFDPGNNFDATTGIFTFPVTGHYIIGASGYFEPNATNTRSMRFEGTGLAVNDANGFGTNYPNLGAGTPVSMYRSEVIFAQQGNTFFVRVSQNSGGDLTIGGCCMFARFLGRT